MPDFAGYASLSICNPMLLALNDRKVLPEQEIVGVLKDAAAAREGAPTGDGTLAVHKAAAALIDAISDGGNSVRHQ